MVFVHIIYDTADAFNDNRIVVFKMNDNLAFKGEQIEILVEVFDDFNHLIDTGSFIIKISS